jgi:regulator of protease activity HflC (stomatin/prohibitin superfamily)
MPGVFPFNIGAIFFLVVFLYILASSFRVLNEYERGVIFRFGRLAKAIFNPGGEGNGPGILILLPFIDKMVRVSTRTIAMDVPSQDVITRDNVSVKVNAVIYFRVVKAESAVVEVEDFLYATSQIAQTTLRSVLGESELDELLSEREQINRKLQRIIDDHTDPSAGRHATGDGAAGGGRAREAGQDHPCRRRAPGLGEARPGRQHHGGGADLDPAPLPPDAHGDRN